MSNQSRRCCNRVNLEWIICGAGVWLLLSSIVALRWWQLGGMTTRSNNSASYDELVEAERIQRVLQDVNGKGVIGRDEILRLVSAAHIVVISKSYCPHSKRLKALLHELKVRATIIDIDKLPVDSSLIQNIQIALSDHLSGISTVPQLFVHGSFISDNNGAHQLHRDGKLLPMLVDSLFNMHTCILDFQKVLN